MSNKSPHPVDVYVGQRLRLRRMLLGLSQTDWGGRNYPAMAGIIVL